MPLATIWTIESDFDRDTIKCLAPKLVTYLGIELDIRVVGKKAFSDIAQKNKRNPNTLERAVKNYLEEADCLIFILDSDSPIRLTRKRQDANSAISQIERVRDKFAEQVYLALAVHELEAWLLIDCIGICCYFAGVDNSVKSRQRQERKFRSLLKNVPGDTELIVEAEAGGKGPKEYLIELSEKILKALDPRIKPHTLNRKRYGEYLSPTLAEYIEINNETLKRNASLERFGQFLAQCGVSG